MKKYTSVILILLLTTNVRSESSNLIEPKNCQENGESCDDHSSKTINPQINEKETVTDDCNLDEFENEQSLSNLRSMLLQGNEEINKQKLDSSNTILVLGNAGAGKTTFVQFLAGDNKKLISKEQPLNSGTYVIEDGIKIGSSVTESFTQYPETIKINYNDSLTDTPGFKDTRSINHEITESYLMKKYMKNISKIKITLVITYYSLQYGAYKDDFINLLRSLKNFLKDINKYKYSTLLVATKVPNTYKKNGTDISLIGNEQVITNIGKYLIDVQKSLKTKVTEANIVKDIDFYENAIKFIDALLENDENAVYKRINIFRQPLESGILSEMLSLQNNKEYLLKSLNSIEYMDVSQDDIGYTLSVSAKNYLNCLSLYINHKVSLESQNMFELIEKHYESKINNYSDIHSLNTELEEITRKLKSLKSNLQTSKNYKNYKNIINSLTIKEKISLDKYFNHTVTVLNYELDEFVKNIYHFTNSSNIISPIIWTEHMNGLLNYIEENLIWNKFLIISMEYYSSYDIQNSKYKIFNNTDKIYSELLKMAFLNFDYGKNDSSNDFNSVVLSDKSKMEELNELQSVLLHSENNVTCDSGGKLIVKGYYIKLSEINNLIKENCNNLKIKFIGINAVQTVFIDADLNEEKFKGINIMIAAPKWEIIGKRIISIDGIDGKKYNQTKADDGNIFDKNGKNGLPGLPGGHGGTFLGIGLQFINEKNLKISVNGGNGGPGQDGGNGFKGDNGKDGLHKFDEISMNTNQNYDNRWTNAYESVSRIPRYNYLFPLNEVDGYNVSDIIKGYGDTCEGDVLVYSKNGDCGNAGGMGGNGGKGGIRGTKGDTILIGLNGSPQFLVESTEGTTGPPGIGGNGGEQGEKGNPSTCFNLRIKNYNYGNYYKNNWICTEFGNKTETCDDQLVTNGLSDYETFEIQQPEPQQKYDYSSDLYKYTLLLKNYEHNKYFGYQIKKLTNEISNVLYKMNNVFWRFIFVQDTKPNNNI